MKKLNVPTKRGTVLNGVLFDVENADTVVIAITGIHGNFYSNPFYSLRILPTPTFDKEPKSLSSACDDGQ